MASMLGTIMCHVHKSADVFCPTLTPRLSSPVCTSASFGGGSLKGVLTAFPNSCGTLHITCWVLGDPGGQQLWRK